MQLFTIPRFLRDGIIILGITIFGLLGILAVVDAVAYLGLDIRAPGHAADRFFQHHPVVGRIQRPQAQGYWYRYSDGSKYWVEINAFGFADQPREIRKRRPRIALVGDSTAQFWEAPPAARGHVRLEERLQGAWEVLNFGVRGYGIDQSHLLYQEKVAPFFPEIVVLHICVNDIWDHAVTAGKPYYVLDQKSPGGIQLRGVPVPRDKSVASEGGMRWFLWNYSYTLRRLGLIRHPQLKAFYPLEEHFELRPFKKEYNLRDEELLELTWRIIARFAADLDRRGARLLLVEMPYRPALTEQERRQINNLYGDLFDFDKWPVLLQQFSQREGIALVSLSDVIKARGLDAASLFHPEDQLHMNSKGVELYVDVVVERLESLDWLTFPAAAVSIDGQ